MVFTPSPTAPTFAPSADPTSSPSADPSMTPTKAPSADPSAAPSDSPSVQPMTSAPSESPSFAPSADPTLAPTAPTLSPSAVPSSSPTAVPSAAPIVSAMGIIDGVWTDDFRAATNGSRGWSLSNGNGDDLGNPVVAGGSGTVYHGPIQPLDSSNSAQHIVKLRRRHDL